ncbi:hypothetical protein B296_00010710 [Ensete ventricosum]|uniref:Uncharacterized protein n=1 Tax=Ensete ventricosum TaxID=4639 RepID=A0A427AHT3_ENSVE|nr:hypothetical protein B296_00010710 [Ensete ventricosum]
MNQQNQTKGCRSRDWFRPDHKSGFATEQVQQSGSLHELPQPDVVELPFRVEFLDSGPQRLNLVGEAEKGLSRDDKWCGVGHRWWEPRVDHHPLETVWSLPRCGDLFRLLRVVRLRTVFRIQVSKRVFLRHGVLQLHLSHLLLVSTPVTSGGDASEHCEENSGSRKCLVVGGGATNTSRVFLDSVDGEKKNLSWREWMPDSPTRTLARVGKGIAVVAETYPSPYRRKSSDSVGPHLGSRHTAGFTATKNVSILGSFVVFPQNRWVPRFGPPPSFDLT